MKTFAYFVSAFAITACTSALNTGSGTSGTMVSAERIGADIRTVSSDAFLGRAPATPGEELTISYIRNRLQAAGLQPGGPNGSWFQEVPLSKSDIIGRPSVSVNVGGLVVPLQQGEQIAVRASMQDVDRVDIQNAPIVFLGYGVRAPERRWDDFKGEELRGKIGIVLINDPDFESGQGDFGGKAMTYYGRWTYKFEEAERRGAAGALIIHTTERAGYPWHTVVGSWAKEQRMLPRDPKLPAPLGVRGWITDSAATALISSAGLDLAALRKQAESRDFRPVATRITMDISFRNDVQRQQSENVVGVVRGREAAARDEYIVFSSHWDHLGVGPVVDGDSIYNGAADNASGVANLLAVARAAAQGPAPRRSLLFVFVTAEESGLLGSEFFASRPTVPIAKIVANLNMDGGNLLGESRDLRVLGDTKSSLGPMLTRLIAPRGMRISPDQHPERGYFYRSDHFSFAKAGVPAVSIAAGFDYVGRPAGWGKERADEYNARHYHQPSDEYRADFDLRGAAQLSRIVLDFALSLANTKVWPTWNTDAEFERVAGGGEGQSVP